MMQTQDLMHFRDHLPESRGMMLRHTDRLSMIFVRGSFALMGVLMAIFVIFGFLEYMGYMSFPCGFLW